MSQNKKYMRPLDIRKDQHRHTLEKYLSYDRFILEDVQYDQIITLLQGTIDQLIVEIEAPYQKGVIVAKQPDEAHLMYYVFDIEGENNIIHAFNGKEGYLFSLEMKDGGISTKDVHPFLQHMPKEELKAFQGFASNYYYALMFYLSYSKNKQSLHCTEEKYLKKKKKGKKKISKWQSRNRYTFPANWKKLLPDKQEIKGKSVTKDDAKRIIEKLKEEEAQRVNKAMNEVNSVEIIEVKGHYRKLKNGSQVWVEGYKREKKSG